MDRWKNDEDWRPNKRISQLAIFSNDWWCIYIHHHIYIVWPSEQFSGFQSVISISRGLLLHNQRLSEDKLHSLHTINTIVKATPLILIFTHTCCSITNFYCRTVCSQWLHFWYIKLCQLKNVRIILSECICPQCSATLTTLWNKVIFFKDLGLKETFK